jgi:DNA-binding NarL/FixJ family response regulator
LSTLLSFPEIAAEMFLSRTTIKLEALSPYRKLGASSRCQADALSHEVGLLKGSGPATSRTEAITSAVSSGEQGWAD